MIALIFSVSFQFAVEQCEHMASAIEALRWEIESGDKVAQETIALYETACHVTMHDADYEIDYWRCIMKLTPGEAVSCQFTLEREE